MKKSTIFQMAIVMGFLFFLSSNAFAQLDKRIRKAKVVPGTILKDGQFVEGYIKRASETAYQLKIKFIEKAKFEDESVKIKNRDFTSYKPKEIGGFEIDDVFYESVKFAPPTFQEGGGKMQIGLVRINFFLRRGEENKITFYEYVYTEETEDRFENITKENVVLLVYKKGESGKLKSVSALDVKRELADCPKVITKFKNREYNEQIVKNEKWNNLFNGLKNDYEMNIRILEDYNDLCK